MRFLARPNGRLAAFLFSCLTVWAAQSAAAAPPEPPPIFVLNSLDASVSVINPVDWTEKQRIATGKEPHHIYMTPDEKSVIVANSAGAAAADCAAQTVRQENRKAARRPFGRARNRKGKFRKSAFDYQRPDPTGG